MVGRRAARRARSRASTPRTRRAATSHSWRRTTWAATRSRRSRATVSPGESHALINVNVVNDPPVITCTSLVTHEDTPLVIPVAACVTRSERRSPHRRSRLPRTGGTVERVAGTWRFIPAPKSTAPGSFVLQPRRRRLDRPYPISMRHDRQNPTARSRSGDERASARVIARGAALRFAAPPWTTPADPLAQLELRRRLPRRPAARRSRTASGGEGTFTVKVTAPARRRRSRCIVRRRPSSSSAPRVSTTA